MSYLQFHIAFILPPIALLVWALRGRWRQLPPRALPSLAALAAIAFVYTTPWDNYLVWRGVWGYGNDRVLGTIGFVPIEEYLFFVLQPVLTGLWLLLLVARDRGEPERPGGSAVRWIGVLAWFVMGIAGALMLRGDAGVYLGLILTWAAPVLAGQWAYAAPQVWARRHLLVTGFAAPTLYLCAADWVAIRLGIWEVSPVYTTGLMLDALPIEEATFFLVTNLLVVQGLMLFLLPPAASSRPAHGLAETAAT